MIIVTIIVIFLFCSPARGKKKRNKKYALSSLAVHNIMMSAETKTETCDEKTKLFSSFLPRGLLRQPHRSTCRRHWNDKITIDVRRLFMCAAWRENDKWLRPKRLEFAGNVVRARRHRRLNEWKTKILVVTCSFLSHLLDALYSHPENTARHPIRVKSFRANVVSENDDTVTIWPRSK